MGLPLLTEGKRRKGKEGAIKRPNKIKNKKKKKMKKTERKKKKKIRRASKT
jgi:hypothetical protein